MVWKAVKIQVCLKLCRNSQNQVWTKQAKHTLSFLLGVHFLSSSKNYVQPLVHCLLLAIRKSPNFILNLNTMVILICWAYLKKWFIRFCIGIIFYDVLDNAWTEFKNNKLFTLNSIKFIIFNLTYLLLILIL